MCQREFVDDLAARGVSGKTSEYLYNFALPYCIAGNLLNPADKLEKDLMIDGGDVEDAVEEFFVEFGLAMPTASQPTILPQDATFTELGLWLDRKRSDTWGQTALEAQV